MDQERYDSSLKKRRTILDMIDKYLTKGDIGLRYNNGVLKLMRAGCFVQEVSVTGRCGFCHEFYDDSSGGCYNCPLYNRYRVCSNIRLKVNEYTAFWKAHDALNCRDYEKAKVYVSRVLLAIEHYGYQNGLLGYVKDYDIRHSDLCKKKVIDLSSMQGNQEILFQFKGPDAWVEGYLWNVDESKSDLPYSRAFKWDHGLAPHSRGGKLHFAKIRFQTDRWYSWDGGDCPLPEGVEVEYKMRGLTVDKGKVIYLTWNRGIVSPSCEIIAYRPIGLAEGYKYGWEDDE